MVESTDANEGYDDLLGAVADGQPYYLRCPEGHGSLPPRRVCPRCGRDGLEEAPLADTGRVETFTVVHVATPQLVEDVPYVSAIARFEPVRVTGFLRGIEPEAVTVGLEVALSVGTTETTGERVLVLRPA